jgi:hypothetical protein
LASRAANGLAGPFGSLLWRHRLERALAADPAAFGALPAEVLQHFGRKFLGHASHKKANGERVGTIPFGFRMAEDGLLAEDPAEQGVLARMRELKASGHTVREIADELNRQGYTTRRGTAWRFQYVAAALKAA